MAWFDLETNTIMYVYFNPFHTKKWFKKTKTPFFGRIEADKTKQTQFMNKS